MSGVWSDPRDESGETLDYVDLPKCYRCGAVIITHHPVDMAAGVSIASAGSNHQQEASYVRRMGARPSEWKWIWPEQKLCEWDNLCVDWRSQSESIPPWMDPTERCKRCDRPMGMFDDRLMHEPYDGSVCFINGRCIGGSRGTKSGNDNGKR